MKQNVLLFLLAMGIVSCTPRIRAKDVDSIVFWAMQKEIEFCHGNSTLEGIKRQGADTLITDRQLIRDFIKLVNALEPLEGEWSYDLRCAAIIKKKDHSEIVIMFGRPIGILYENQNMKHNPDLFKLIDDRIIATQQWDYWMPEPARRMYRLINEEHERYEKYENNAQ